MSRGLFLTVEGMDGSGKTTQIERMKEYFENKNLNVIVTREPGGTGISEKIRSIILDRSNSKMSDITEMLLYASSRAQIVSECIKPALEAGKIVICDRFIDSTYAYQCYGRGLNKETVTLVNDIALDGVLPHITLFLDIDPKISIQRTLKRGMDVNVDRIEQEEASFHYRVYNGYKSLLSMYPERMKSIRADDSIDEVFNRIKNEIEMILVNKGI